MLDQLYWAFIAEKIFFSIFSNLALLLAISTIASRNPVYSILSLIGLFVVSSFMMILVGAEFLAFVYIMVYVGAVAVLFLFIIMMINVKSVPLRNDYNSNLFFLALVPFIVITFFWEQYNEREKLIITVAGYDDGRVYSRIYSSLDQFFLENPTKKDFFEVTSPNVLHQPSWEKLLPYFHKDHGGSEALKIYRKAPYSFMKFYVTYVYYFCFKVPAIHSPSLVYPSHNIEALGYVLYTYYFFPFILLGIILLVAMVGAIVLTKYQRTESKRQQIYSQILAQNTVKKVRLPYF